VRWLWRPPVTAQFPRLPRGAEKAMKTAKDISDLDITTEQDSHHGKEVPAGPDAFQFMTVFR